MCAARFDDGGGWEAAASAASSSASPSSSSSASSSSASSSSSSASPYASYRVCAVYDSKKHKVTCVEAWGDSLLVALNDGTLRMFDSDDDKAVWRDREIRLPDLALSSSARIEHMSVIDFTYSSNRTLKTAPWQLLLRQLSSSSTSGGGSGTGGTTESSVLVLLVNGVIHMFALPTLRRIRPSVSPLSLIAPVSQQSAYAPIEQLKHCTYLAFNTSHFCAENRWSATSSSAATATSMSSASAHASDGVNGGGTDGSLHNHSSSGSGSSSTSTIVSPSVTSQVLRVCVSSASKTKSLHFFQWRDQSNFNQIEGEWEGGRGRSKTGRIIGQVESAVPDYVHEIKCMEWCGEHVCVGFVGSNKYPSGYAIVDANTAQWTFKFSLGKKTSSPAMTVLTPMPALPAASSDANHSQQQQQHQQSDTPDSSTDTSRATSPTHRSRSITSPTSTALAASTATMTTATTTTSSAGGAAAAAAAAAAAVARSREFLLLIQDDRGIFIDHEALPCRKEEDSIVFTDAPNTLCYAAPYVVACLPARIEIRNVRTGLPTQSESLKDTARWCVRKGQSIFVCGTSYIRCLFPIPLRELVEQFMSKSMFKDAINLVQLSDEVQWSSRVEREQRLNEITTLYAYELFNRQEYAQAMMYFQQSQCDPRTVISLFPDVLPSSSGALYRSMQAVVKHPVRVTSAQGEQALLRALAALIPYLAQIQARLRLQLQQLQRRTPRSSVNSSRAGSISVGGGSGGGGGGGRGSVVSVSGIPGLGRGPGHGSPARGAAYSLSRHLREASDDRESIDGDHEDARVEEGDASGDASSAEDGSASPSVSRVVATGSPSRAGHSSRVPTASASAAAGAASAAGSAAISTGRIDRTMRVVASKPKRRMPSVVPAELLNSSAASATSNASSTASSTTSVTMRSSNVHHRRGVGSNGSGGSVGSVGSGSELGSSPLLKLASPSLGSSASSSLAGTPRSLALDEADDADNIDDDGDNHANDDDNADADDAEASRSDESSAASACVSGSSRASPSHSPASSVDFDERTDPLFALAVLVDTVLLKAYLLTDIPLLPFLQQPNLCDITECSAILRTYEKYPELVCLYQSRRCHRQALELLAMLGQSQSSPTSASSTSSASSASSSSSSPSSSLHGPLATVKYLQNLCSSVYGDATTIALIVEFSRWVFAVDMQLGLSIFTHCHTSPAGGAAHPHAQTCMSSVAVLEHLSRVADRNTCIAYLESLIANVGETNAMFHNELVLMYLESVLKAMKQQQQLQQQQQGASAESSSSASSSPSSLLTALDQRIVSTRSKLITFLRKSMYYTPESLLSKFPRHHLLEERAILLSRVNQHEQALAIIALQLNDAAGAEQYCRAFYQHQLMEGRDLFASLLHVYLRTGGGDTSATAAAAGAHHTRSGTNGVGVGASASSSSSSPSTSVVPMSRLAPAIHLLTKHHARIDPLAAIELLPLSTPLHMLTNWLEVLIRRRAHDRRSRQVVKQLHRADHMRVRSELLNVGRLAAVLDDDTLCAKCNKKIGQSAFARFPNGLLMHYVCFTIQT